MTSMEEVKISQQFLIGMDQKEKTLLFYKAYIKCLKKLTESSTESSQTAGKNSKRKQSSTSVFDLKGIMSYFRCGTQTYICGLCLLNRFLNIQQQKSSKQLPNKQQPIKLTQKNIYKLVSVALLIATKNFDDFYYANKYYARVCGLSVQQLNLLEAEFLKIIDFNVFVGSEQYTQYEAILLRSEQIIYSQYCMHSDVQNTLKDQNQQNTNKINLQNLNNVKKTVQKPHTYHHNNQMNQNEECSISTDVQIAAA